MWSIGASCLGFLQGSADPPKALLSSGVSTQCEELWPSLPSLKSPRITAGVPVATSSDIVASWRRSASLRCAAAFP